MSLMTRTLILREMPEITTELRLMSNLTLKQERKTTLNQKKSMNCQNPPRLQLIPLGQQTIPQRLLTVDPDKVEETENTEDSAANDKVCATDFENA